MPVEIIVASIAALGTLGGAALAIIPEIRKLSRRNDMQHADNSRVLFSIHQRIGEVSGKIDSVQTSLDDHLGWHASRPTPPET